MVHQEDAVEPRNPDIHLIHSNEVSDDFVSLSLQIANSVLNPWRFQVLP
jgi:hypothetical protein